MADNHTKIQRSQNMSSIRSTGNKSTEMALISLLRKNKIAGWKRRTKLTGRPDFIFKNKKIAVFVDGCFWHGCPKHFLMPLSNMDYWQKKIARNIKRDREVKSYYVDKGWKVIRIWEHELKNNKSSKNPLRRILKVF